MMIYGTEVSRTSLPARFLYGKIWKVKFHIFPDLCVNRKYIRSGLVRNTMAEKKKKANTPEDEQALEKIIRERVQ